MRTLAWKLMISTAMISTAPAALAAQSTWTVDTTASAVRFRVQHMVIHHVRGEFHRFAGRVTASDASFRDARVEAAVDVRSIDTGRPPRDANLRSTEFFDAERFPAMTFTSDHVSPREGGGLMMEGDLTLHGVTLPVRFTVDPDSPGRPDPGAPRFVARTTINRFDFGLRYDTNDFLAALSRAVPVVGDSVEIELDVVLRAASDTVGIAASGGR